MPHLIGGPNGLVFRIFMASYPYHAKYTQRGDFTFVRNLDMNIPTYLSHGHGVNLIQASMSLDDANEDGCTEILPGFHKRTGQGLQ